MYEVLTRKISRSVLHAEACVGVSLDPSQPSQGMHCLVAAPDKTQTGKTQTKIKAKARQLSPTQALASLDIDPLQSLKSLGKYFPFKIALYGDGEPFCKQRLLILP